MHFDSVLVSTTEVCTVGCRHCGFTGATRDREPEPAELGEWVAQVCDFGVPKVILTGGEPFQRFPLLAAAVAAAARHDPPVEVGVFTSSFWARNPASVRTRLGQLAGLTHLYLSTDIYHQERVPAGYVRNVVEAADELGIPDISLCITIAEDWEKDVVLEPFVDLLDRVMVHVDRVIPTPFISVAAVTGSPPRPEHFEPTCFLETPLINPNGDLSACHIGKAGAYVDLTEQVYFLGNLHEHTFGELMRAAEDNYEYQFLRVYGPQGIARMVAGSPPLSSVLAGRTFTNGCDLCYKILRSAEGRQALGELVADPLQRRLVDAARLVRFGETAPAQPVAP